MAEIFLIVEAVPQLLLALKIFLLFGFKALFAFLFLTILNCWAAPVMTIMAFGLAVLSVFISMEANKIAKESDKKMTAIADSQIDEKLAMMAAYREAVDGMSELLTTGKNITPDSYRNKHGLNQKVWSLNETRKLNSDFYAIYDLKKYASDKKNE